MTPNKEEARRSLSNSSIPNSLGRIEGCAGWNLIGSAELFPQRLIATIFLPSRLIKTRSSWGRSGQWISMVHGWIMICPYYFGFACIIKNGHTDTFCTRTTLFFGLGKDPLSVQYHDTIILYRMMQLWVNLKKIQSSKFSRREKYIQKKYRELGAKVMRWIICTPCLCQPSRLLPSAEKKPLNGNCRWFLFIVLKISNRLIHSILQGALVELVQVSCIVKILNESLFSTIKCVLVDV